MVRPDNWGTARGPPRRAPGPWPAGRHHVQPQNRAAGPQKSIGARCDSRSLPGPADRRRRGRHSSATAAEARGQGAEAPQRARARVEHYAAMKVRGPGTPRAPGGSECTEHSGQQVQRRKVDASCQGLRRGWGVAAMGTEFPCGVKEKSGIRQRWWLHNVGKVLRKCHRTVHFK